MVSAGEQVGAKCSIPFTHITGLWLYDKPFMGARALAPIFLMKNYLINASNNYPIKNLLYFPQKNRIFAPINNN